MSWSPYAVKPKRSCQEVQQLLKRVLCFTGCFFLCLISSKGKSMSKFTKCQEAFSVVTNMCVCRSETNMRAIYEPKAVKSIQCDIFAMKRHRDEEKYKRKPYARSRISPAGCRSHCPRRPVQHVVITFVMSMTLLVDTRPFKHAMA